MKTIDIILIIAFIILLLGFAFFIFYKYFNDKIAKLLFRIRDAEKSLLGKFEDKIQLVNDMLDIVQNKMNIKSKTFSKIKKIDSDSSFIESDKLLNKAYGEIKSIIDDNPKSKDIKKLKSEIKKYEENELHIISLRTYYNKYTLIYNNLVKKFPFIIISKLKNYKLIALFDGEELDMKDELIEV